MYNNDDTDQYLKAAERDDAIRQLRIAWYQERVANIHSRVTAYDILRSNGIKLKQTSDNRPEQIACPFHGADEHPSARVHPEEGGKSSHVYCFVCKEKPWDVIALWKKFSGEDKSFSRILTEIEKAYGLEPPPQPNSLKDILPPKVDHAREQFDKLLDVAERRLLDAKETFRELDDLKGYLTLGQILDKVLFQVDKAKTTSEKGSELVQKVLEKIRQKNSIRIGNVSKSQDTST
jgi:hypothetical protein